MNSNDNQMLIEILVIVLAIFITLFLAVVGILVYKKIMEKKKSKNKEVILNKSKEVKSKEITFKSYTRDSIYNFMEFDKVEDNMIIQKNGKKFLMIVECQGVNYDLMSKIEKVAVEEGFLQFLNSLRHPIQIYVQSRTVNLTSSIENYRRKINEYKIKLDRMLMEYEELSSNPRVKEETLQRYNYEIVKQKNLYEYGKDIVENTEKMNLNKSVLNKKYYVVIPYYSEEASNENLDKEEVKNLAFSELYTRAQSVIRTLYVCDVNAKILNSTELINLLYVAYNRDESEVFDLEKAIQAGCDDIYSTAPDVFENKIKALDEMIERKAQERAEKAFETIKSKKQIIAENRENNIEDLIDEMAKKILDENRTYIGKEATERSKKVIDETKEKREGMKVNEKKKTRRKSN